MPDDQFAARVQPIGTSYATTTRDALVAPPNSRVTSAPGPAVRHDEPCPRSLLRQQERIIQSNYDRMIAEDLAADASAGSVAYQYTKRVLDISLALPALIILSPVMLIVALLIRIDSTGPAIFKQHRVGKDGWLFCMYKFRSMSVNAGVKLQGDHKTQTDSRVTRVGRIIRKTSLDELPQLVNVLLGQMSLVGPRPELPEIVLQRYESWQYRRLSVPQGITGWWQVTGRGQKMLWKHTGDDLYYVDRASFWFDLKLLVMTIRTVISRDGAF